MFKWIYTACTKNSKISKNNWDWSPIVQNAQIDIIAHFYCNRHFFFPLNRAPTGSVFVELACFFPLKSLNKSQHNKLLAHLSLCSFRVAVTNSFAQCSLVLILFFKWKFNIFLHGCKSSIFWIDFCSVKISEGGSKTDFCFLDS